MTFAFKSIRQQIMTAAGASLLAAVVAMLLYGINAGQSLYQETSADMLSYARQNVKESIQRVSAEVTQIGNTVSNGLTVAESMATSAEFLVANEHTNTFDRSKLSNLVGYTLKKNTALTGAYMHFEPNALDNQDNAHQDNGVHSTTEGQFTPYWSRSSGDNVSVRPSNLDNLYDLQRNKRGLRNAEWYLCPKETLTGCIADPQIWEVQGVPTLMTSLTTPIIVNGKFIGLAGVDLSVSFIQALAERVNKSIYDGAGTLSVISYNGGIVADTGDFSRAGEWLNDEQWNDLESALRNGEKIIEVGDTMVSVLLPLTFTNTNAKWAVKIELPTAVALADVNKLNAILDQRFSHSLMGQLIAGILVGVVGFLFIMMVATRIAKPVQETTEIVAELSQSDGDLTKRIRIKQKNELRKLADSLNLFLEKTHQIVRETCDSVTDLKLAAHESASLSHQTDTSVNDQKAELEQVASAVYQMSQASGEVASNCSNTAEAAENAHNKVIECAGGLEETVNSLRDFTRRMHAAAADMTDLENATNSISGILSVIRGISEQTNLLALNAAIEAARAGEQGRGFAVVADEVRNLAHRTHQSTEEINSLIETLVKQSEGAVMAMREGTITCERNMERANVSQLQLQEVVDATQQISSSSTSIASAVEQQNAVAAEISQNINNISDQVNSVSQYAKLASDQSRRIDDVANEISHKLNQFKY